MENIDTLFNFCVIVAFSIIAIWAIRIGLEFKAEMREARKEGNKKKATASLARQQNTLVAVAEEQKAYNGN